MVLDRRINMTREESIKEELRKRKYEIIMMVEYPKVKVVIPRGSVIPEGFELVKEDDDEY